MTQDTLITRKRRGPPPTGKGTLLGVRVQPDLLADLDAWIAEQPEPRPTRPDAMRRLLADYLVTMGIRKP